MFKKERPVVVEFYNYGGVKVKNLPKNSPISESVTYALAVARLWNEAYVKRGEAQLLAIKIFEFFKALVNNGEVPEVTPAVETDEQPAPTE